LLRIYPTKSNIGANGFVEEMASLLDEGDVIPKPAPVKSLYINSVKKNGSASGGIETKQHRAYSAFATSTFPNQIGRLSRWEGKVTMIQNKMSRI